MFTIANNQQHLERRRQVNEFYAASALNALAYRADHVSRILFAKLARRASYDGDTPLDVCKLVNYYAYDALANLTVSLKSYHSLNLADDFIPSLAKFLAAWRTKKTSTASLKELQVFSNMA